MAGQKDFLDIIRHIRGSAAPGQPLKDGIWYELTVADKNGNPGIYGDILAKYGIVTDSAGTFDQAVAILENLNVEVTTLPAGSEATSALVNGVWQIGIPKGVNGIDGSDGNTPEVAMAYNSGNLKYTVTVDGVVVTNTTLLNLDALVDSKVSTNVGVQETLDAKQEVIDKVDEAQGLVDNLSQSVTIKKQEIVDLAETKKQEIVDEGEVQTEFIRDVGEEVIQEFDEHALHRTNQYDSNHATKIAAYNENDSIKMAQYNENHIERLENINYAYADRIVEMIKTRNFMGILDEYVPKTATHMITFLDTVDSNYIYYANGTLLTEGLDYTIYDSKTIELTVKANPYDVIVQVNTGVLNEMLTAEGVLFDYMIGQPNGVAGLNEIGQVPAEQLPSYVDDVIEVDTYADLPVVGESSKIYVVVTDETSNDDTSTYRWTGTSYAMVSNTLNASDVKALYESNADTNAFTDAEKLKLADTEVTAELDLRDTANRDRANHTGTQSLETITETINLKVMTATERTKLEGVEEGATGDQTAEEILTLLKTVDGSGSELDADLLDGQDSTYYLDASNINAGTLDDARLPDTITSDITGNAATATKLQTARSINGVAFDGSANITVSDSTAVKKSANLSDLTNKGTARINLGLGTAATKDVGTSSGNVMEVGAFGIGLSNSPVIPRGEDLNLCIIAGNYTLVGDNANTPPQLGTGASGTMVVIARAYTPGAGLTQIIYNRSQNVRVFMRTGDKSTNWTEWVELHHTGNILTSTGQSTEYPMTQKAVTDALNTKVGLTGSQTIGGVKTFSSTIVGNINGNSATATKLATPVKINNKFFDGSTNINLEEDAMVVKEKVVNLTGDVIQTSLGSVFIKTITKNTTLTLTTSYNTGEANSFILELTNGGNYTITWWSNIKWDGGEAPELTNNGKDVLGFYSYGSPRVTVGVVLSKDAK